MNDNDTPSTLRDAAEQRFVAARDAAGRALDRTRDGASNAYGSTRDGTRDALKRAGNAVAANPLVVLIGGAAIGVLAGAVLPRTARETRLLGSAGKRLTTTAAAAATAAREAGLEELDARGISRKAARDQVSRLFDNVLKAANSAGEAAAGAATAKGEAARKAK